MQSIYNFHALEFNGEKKSLGDYHDKVLLIVNTASKCMFTKQYKGLEKLYQKYKDKGFEILAFPSDNFNHQEPLTGIRLETFCRLQQQITFPVFKRTHVVGEYVDPLFKYLSHKELNGKFDCRPLWNFHKYLINRKGEVVDYFYPFTGPNTARLHRKIETLLNE
ncbi:glutathione peroxidase [Sphingobacterium sp. SYP-B4668]|uniref:glutathione peroxidase n=1 Tax=Sphingobacterium sp. SYP-B4668 TaxID=2996035 RepID=UPI0022DDD111|nr:redoxin domain-containing protein [Sphingobacterium sp. SYP-B4668]